MISMKNLVLKYVQMEEDFSYWTDGTPISTIEKQYKNDLQECYILYRDMCKKLKDSITLGENDIDITLDYYGKIYVY